MNGWMNGWMEGRDGGREGWMDRWMNGRQTGRSLTWHSFLLLFWMWASLVAQTVRNPPAMQAIWVQSLSQEDCLEKGMAAHSSILAWRFPWIEEHRLQSMRSHRIGHGWATNINTFWMYFPQYLLKIDVIGQFMHKLTLWTHPGTWEACWHWKLDWCLINYKPALLCVSDRSSWTHCSGQWKTDQMERTDSGTSPACCWSELRTHS